MVVRFSQERSRRIEEISKVLLDGGRLGFSTRKNIALNAVDDICFKPERSDLILNTARDMFRATGARQYKLLVRKIEKTVASVIVTK